jgi:hypothetical protein
MPASGALSAGRTIRLAINRRLRITPVSPPVADAERYRNMTGCAVRLKSSFDRPKELNQFASDSH